MSIWRNFKNGWFRGVRHLGKLQTRLVLFLFYLLGMGLLRLYMLVTFKDPLGKRRKKADSYWKTRSGIPKPESFKRQF